MYIASELLIVLIEIAIIHLYLQGLRKRFHCGCGFRATFCLVQQLRRFLSYLTHLT